MGSISVYISMVLFITIGCVQSDSIDRGIREGVLLKYLREMVNQTKADSLNLPANATSIRENITDTFSCENRTYGYYADVDNECQVFHVCLTTQAASGRNTTYRWSFICPKETVFNQEVLTCTYPRDSINCEDSPNYYDVNMEIGKVPYDTNTNTMNNNDNNMYNNQNNMNNNNYNQNNNMNNNYYNQNGNMNNNNQNTNMNNYNQNNNYGPTRRNPNAEMIKVNDQRKQSNRRKQNIIIENLQKVVEKENFGTNLEAISNIDEALIPVIEVTEDESFDENVPEEKIIENPPKLENKKKASNKSQNAVKEHTKTESNENPRQPVKDEYRKAVNKIEKRKTSANRKQNVMKENKKNDKFHTPIWQDSKVEIKNVDIYDGMLLPILENAKPLDVASLRQYTDDSRLTTERKKRQERKLRGNIKFKLNV